MMHFTTVHQRKRDRKPLRSSAPSQPRSTAAKRFEQSLQSKRLKKTSTTTSFSATSISVQQNRKERLEHRIFIASDNYIACRPLMQFWQTYWYSRQEIDPEILSLLKEMLDERLLDFKNKMRFLKQKDMQLNNNTVMIWAFYHWLSIALGDIETPIPDLYPAPIRQKFFQRFNFEDYSQHIQKSLYVKKANAQPEALKHQFSKLLTESLLKTALENKNFSFSKIEDIFTAINLLIEVGNAVGRWDLCFISNVVVPHHETNPFADSSEWNRALRMERVLTLIETHLPAQFNNPEFMQSALIVSLMADSYILNEKVLASVVKQLNRPQSLMRIGQQIAFYIPEGSKRLARTIFLSPITELYYRQCLKLSQNSQHPFKLSLTFPNKAFYQVLGLSAKTLKLSTFKSWKRAVVAYLNLDHNLSGLLIEHVAHKQQSSTLKAPVLFRLFEVENCQPISQTVTSGFSPMNFSDHQRLPRSYNWSKIRSILNVTHINPKKEAQTHQSLQAHLRDLKPKCTDPLEKLIIEYAIDRLSPNKKGRYLLSPTTILTHIDAFGLPLIVANHGLDFESHDPLKRQEIYLYAIEMPGIKQERFRYYLKIFEDWFSGRASKPSNIPKRSKKAKKTEQPEDKVRLPDYEALFDDVKRPEFKVDANIISFDEYEQIKLALLEAYLSSNGKEVVYLQAIILLMFGFKLGLRRGEAIHLYSDDLEFDTREPTLFIQPHDSHKLKTSNARRHYHLEEHLNAEDLGILKEYLTWKKIKDPKRKPKEFFGKPKPSELKHMVTTLLKAIHDVTGDSSLKFHNLRHSKASWDMLSILNAQFELNLEEQFFGHKPHTAAFLKAGKARWQRAVQTEQSFHKAPFFLKKVIGHGDLTTTLKHYIHTIDFAIAGLQQKRAHETLTIKRLVALGIASKTTLYDKSKDRPLFEVALESVYPMATRSQPSVPPDLKTRSPDEPQKHRETPNTKTVLPLRPSDTLNPRGSLEKLKPYCLFQVYHLLDDPVKAQDYLQKAGMEKLGLQVLIEHFKQTPAYRFKQPTSQQSQSRLLTFYQSLPEAWRNAIEDESFFTSDKYLEERKLIEHFVRRLTIKVEDKNNPLSPVKEYDLICHDFEDGRKLVTLLRRIGVIFSCKFMPPKSGEITWKVWQLELCLNEGEFNESNVLTGKVGNPRGRLIIKLHREKGKGAKWFEAYWLLCAID